MPELPRTALRGREKGLRIVWLSFATALLAASPAHAQGVKLVGAPELVFDGALDGCTADDMPDVNARAFHDDAGNVVLFALHVQNRRLRGPDLDHLTLDCRPALDSAFDAAPAHYNDRSFVTATWTDDGRQVSALVHHEYHADAHGLCRTTGDLACWYNSILAYRSADGGATFRKQTPLVVAAAPFRQDVEQGRHRGFFNPSNIFADGRYKYMLASTTGWAGQPFGACLFRTTDPADPAGWRAFDGQTFSIVYADPYGPPAPAPKSCSIIAPFTFPVGAVVRLPSGEWLAVFQAARNDGMFPVDGFYTSRARDLTRWSAPALLKAGPTLFNDPCKAGERIMAYPSILARGAKGRNFDDATRDTYLYFASIAVETCATGHRTLMRQRLAFDEPQVRR